jgi:hypothetical protein
MAAQNRESPSDVPRSTRRKIRDLQCLARRAARCGETSKSLRETSNQNHTMNAIKGALLSDAASRLGSVLGDLLSGYKEEVRNGRHQRFRERRGTVRAGINLQRDAEGLFGRGS